MSNPLLSILIPTTPDRNDSLSHLITCINKQQYTRRSTFYDIGKMSCIRYFDLLCPIEILVFEDERFMTIGEKREILYKHSVGEYSWQIDSDDLISDNSIELIIKSIQETPNIHCITFREKCLMNGDYKSSNHSIKYEKWQDNFDGYDYVRTPFYKDVIRTDIAQSVHFPKIRWNEDEQWSYAIKPFLTDEVHIDEELYIYQYNSKPDEFNFRYGIDRG